MWAQFLYGVATTIGLLLLVIPGLFIGVLWHFGLQAIVADELPAWEALKRSREVVKGRWWAFFGRLVILYVLMILISGFLMVPNVFLADSVLAQVLISIPIDLVAAFFTVCLTVLYLKSLPAVSQLAGEAGGAGMAEQSVATDS